MMRGYYFDMGWMYKPLCIVTEDVSEAMKKVSELFPNRELNPISVICSKIFLPYYGEYFWHIEKPDDFAVRLTDKEIDILHLN